MITDKRLAEIRGDERARQFPTYAELLELVECYAAAQAYALYCDTSTFKTLMLLFPKATP